MGWNHTKRTIKRTVFGHEIMAEFTELPKEIHVLLIGGKLPHVGSVSIYDKGNQKEKIVLPGHRDDVIGDFWAKELSSQSGCVATVVCGIHYDGATPDMIMAIQKQTQEMLDTYLKGKKDAEKYDI